MFVNYKEVLAVIREREKCRNVTITWCDSARAPKSKGHAIAKAVTTIAVKDRIADVLNLGGGGLRGKTTELLKQRSGRPFIKPRAFNLAYGKPDQPQF